MHLQKWFGKGLFAVIGSSIIYLVILAAVGGVAYAVIFHTSSEELTKEEDAFAGATHMWMVNDDDGAPYERIDAEGLDEGNAVDVLLDWMHEEAYTDRARRAIEALESAEFRSIRLWNTDPEGYRSYEIALNDSKGGELKWVIGPDGWTFRNGKARAWLRDNDFGDFCDLLIEAVEGREDLRAEYVRLTGEACKLALEID